MKARPPTAGDALVYPDDERQLVVACELGEALRFLDQHHYTILAQALEYVLALRVIPERHIREAGSIDPAGRAQNQSEAR